MFSFFSSTGFSVAIMGRIKQAVARKGGMRQLLREWTLRLAAWIRSWPKQFTSLLVSASRSVSLFLQPHLSNGNYITVSNYIIVMKIYWVYICNTLKIMPIIQWMVCLLNKNNNSAPPIYTYPFFSWYGLVEIRIQRVLLREVGGPLIEELKITF